MSISVAVIGATGNVGREILTILAERSFPASEVFAVASRQSMGQEVGYGDHKTLRIEAIDNFDFSKAQLALFALEAGLAREYVPKATAAGTIVIDNSSAYRMDEGKD